MKLHLTIQIWRKKHWFLAKCPELDFVSQGRTREEAQKNLLEVIEIQFEEMSRMGTLDEYLEECGYDLTEGVAIRSTRERKDQQRNPLPAPQEAAGI